MIDSRPLASSHLVTFLYKLVRDHVPFGAVEQLVDSIEGNAFLQHRLSESHVAAWAESVAARLTSDSTLAIREYARRGGGDTTIIRVPLTQLPDWARAAFEESTGEESPLDQRLAEADALIKELCEHEGAEGWSADLRRRLDRYDARYLAARPDPMTFELDSEGHLNAVDGGSITLTEVSPQSPTESSRSTDTPAAGPVAGLTLAEAQEADYILVVKGDTIKFLKDKRGNSTALDLVDPKEAYEITKEGARCRDTPGAVNPYRPNTMRSSLHTQGWLTRDLQLCLARSNPAYRKNQLASGTITEEGIRGGYGFESHTVFVEDQG